MQLPGMIMIQHMRILIYHIIQNSFERYSSSVLKMRHYGYVKGLSTSFKDCLVECSRKMLLANEIKVWASVWPKARRNAIYLL
jgi:hypothetical protein